MVIRPLHAMSVAKSPPLENPFATLLVPISSAQTRPPALPDLLHGLSKSSRKREVRVWWGLRESIPLPLHLQFLVYPRGRVGIDWELVRRLFHVRSNKGVITAAKNDDLGGSGAEGYGVQ